MRRRVPDISKITALTGYTPRIGIDEALRLTCEWFRAQRWFRSKARRIKSVALHDWLAVPTPAAQAGLAIFDVDFTDGESERYVLPLALAPAHSEEQERIARELPQAVIALVRPPAADGHATTELAPDWLLYDAAYDPAFSGALLDAVENRRRIGGRQGHVTATPTRAFRALRGRGELAGSAGRAEQSNTSVLFGTRMLMKLFRKVEPGRHPELEMRAHRSIARALVGLGTDGSSSMEAIPSGRSRSKPERG